MEAKTLRARAIERERERPIRESPLGQTSLMIRTYSDIRDANSQALRNLMESRHRDHLNREEDYIRKEDCLPESGAAENTVDVCKCIMMTIAASACL